MKPHTSDFKNAIKEMGRELRGVITYGNTTLEEEIMSITPHYEANILKSVMKQLDLELSVDIPLETVINCQIGILVDEEYEMLNFGNYVVYSSEKQEDTNTYKIVCYDKLLYSMKQNEDLGVTYPITIKNYLTALATKIGLTVASGTFYNQDMQIPSELYVGLEYTYRDILDEIAQATGSIITLNNNDEIEVRYPNDLGSTATVNGTNITIAEHTGNRIINTIISGNSVQDGTPTPSSPALIKSAGDNINLFDKTANITRGYTYTSTGGTAQLNNCFVQEKYIEVESSKDYILSTTNSYVSETDYRLVICEYDSSKNFIKRNLSSTQYYKITTSATTKYVRLCASTVTIDELKFEHGSIASPYSSYGMGNINEVISNKNLFKNEYILAPSDNKNAYLRAGTYTLATCDNANFGTNVYIKLFNKNGAVITTNGHLVGINTSMNFSTSSYNYYAGAATNYITFTIDNDYQLAIGLLNADGTRRVMLVKGTTIDRNYVPHQEQNISIPCQQPMRSIGNVRDSFVKIDGVWYEKHNIGQVVLNGSESWGFGGSGVQNINGANVYISSMLKSNFGQGLCNYFIRGTSKTANTLRFGANDSQLWFYVKSTDFANVNDWKTWLSTHNTEVIYQLAEPYYLECTEEQITALENIAHTSLYSGDTHISSEGYLSITYFSTFETIDEEYLKDVNIDFSEVYGPVNSIVLSRAGESDNVYIQDETSVEQNGLCEIKIVDNQIMNFNDRDDYLPGLLSALDGLTYYKNDFNSTGILYYDVGDLYDVKIGENVYRCLMLNDEINVTTGIEERIYTDLPEQSQTDYSKADKTDRRINQTYLIIDKQNQIIESKVGKDEIISKINQTPEAITINANKLGISANDVLNILAGNTLNLTSKNISITSNNFSVDASGNATMNNANITGGEIYIDKLNGGTTPAITVDATSVQKSVEIYGDKIEVNNETDPSRHYNMVIEGDGIYRNGNEYFVMKGLVKDYTPDNSLNQLQDSGFYYVGGNSVSNAPSGFTTWYMVLVVKISNTFIFQYAYSPSTGQIAIRTYSGGTPTWSAWKFIRLQ